MGSDQRIGVECGCDVEGVVIMKLLIAADVEDGKENVARIPQVNGTEVKVVTLQNYRTASRGYQVTEVWSTMRARERRGELDDALDAVRPCTMAWVMREF